MNENKIFSVGKPGRVILARADEGRELTSFILDLARQLEITSGIINAVGAISYAELITPDLDNPKHEGRELKVNEPCEILAVGNLVKETDDSYVVHLHCTLARQDTSALAGHVVKATALYFVEISILEGIGLTAVRRQDPLTTFKVLHFD